MAEQILMPSAVRKYLRTRMTGRGIDGMTIIRVLGVGNTAVTYEVKDSSFLPWALKLVYRESYGDKAPFREVARFAQARDKRFLIFPQQIGECTLEVGGNWEEFRWFRSECIRGENLEHFLASQTQFSAKEEVLRYVENITVALEELRRLGFSHGDLHGRNIMRQVIGAGGLSPEIRYVVIDFSEAYPIEVAQGGLLKDIESFGQHLRSFYDAIYQRDVITREDEKVLAAILHIPGLLNGTFPETMGISRASQVLDTFVDGLRSLEEAPRKLKNPFRPLSAENIANDALFADLCFTKMSWTSEVENNSNVLLIGPRGCGKTMIFRRLRLKTKIGAEKTDEIESDQYVGFYLPCESLFYMRFSDLSEVDIDEYRDALILFFNMSVLEEVCSTLSVLPPSLGPVSQSLTVRIAQLAREEIGYLWAQLKFPATVTNPGEVAECAQQVMRHIRRAIAYHERIHPRGSTPFVTQLVELIKREIPALSTRHFIFFLDDYTEGRVPIALQEALDPIVCQRSQNVFFKLSAHMFGCIYNFPRPLALDEGRNIQVFNLGTAYLKRNRRRAEGKLLLRILDERLKNSVGYEGTIEQWLGRSCYPDGVTLSRALRCEGGTGPRVHYHGVDCLMQLCTGDYSEMIRMVGDIFREAKIEAGTPVRKIKPSTQSIAIVGASQEYLSRIRHIRPDGAKLYNIVRSFGNLSRRLLREHPLVGQGTDSRGRPRKDPYDLLNIYVEDFTQASRSARDVWERLEKASILVDIGIATSQRSYIADRATLRRIYCPAFRIGLTSSEHLQPTRPQFEWFMDEPERFCRKWLRRSLQTPDYPGLWDADVEEEKEQKEEEVGDAGSLPTEEDRVRIVDQAPSEWIEAVHTLPQLASLDDVIAEGSCFDLYIAAVGFEGRTTASAAALVEKGVRVQHVVLLEFDRYYAATRARRQKYQQLALQLTDGKPYVPFNAPVSVSDYAFSERLRELLGVFANSKPARILFDCTSCPSLILSQTLAVLLGFSCDLAVLYSEAAEYFPTLEEWESGKVRPRGQRVEGPFAGVSFVAAPPILQADDTGERPVLLALFPTFNTERTAGVLAELAPAQRVWFFGEPHDLSRNSYRIPMAKSFAAPNMRPGEPWSLISTFDYRETLLVLGGLHAQHRFGHRLVIMPHGSKLQTLGVNLFAAAHQVSMAFAMPKQYDPDRYSRGCLQVWAIPFGATEDLVTKLRSRRVIGRAMI